jgi:hypothetical protein
VGPDQGWCCCWRSNPRTLAAPRCTSQMTLTREQLSPACPTHLKVRKHTVTK